jgi:hypothetical protein
MIKKHRLKALKIQKSDELFLHQLGWNFRTIYAGLETEYE